MFGSIQIYLILVVVGMFAVGASYLAGMHHGSTKAELKSSQQAREVEKRVTDTGEKDAFQIERLHERITALEGKLAKQADEDPGADNRVLGADSVRRINSVGASGHKPAAGASGRVREPGPATRERSDASPSRKAVGE